MIETVQNVTGLHIDHYMGIGFGGLVDVVNDVGGVTLCLPGPMWREPRNTRRENRPACGPATVGMSSRPRRPDRCV